MRSSQQHQAYWRKNLRMTGFLLVIWFGVTFPVGFFAAQLDFDFFGWPFSFWMGAQGALLTYVAIIAFYARYMDKLDTQSQASKDSDTRTDSSSG